MPDTPDKRLPKQARHWVERAGFKLSFHPQLARRHLCQLDTVLLPRRLP